MGVSLWQHGRYTGATMPEAQKRLCEECGLSPERVAELWKEMLDGRSWYHGPDQGRRSLTDIAFRDHSVITAVILVPNRIRKQCY